MTELLLSLAGLRATQAKLRAPRAGIWVAQVDVDDDTELAGAVVLRIGGTELRGTVDPKRSGRFGLAKRFYRVVGGAMGWQSTVKLRPYHNDAGVKRAKVLADLARDVGETLTLSADVDATRLGVDFLRQVAPASRILAQVLPSSTPWWVGFDGVTGLGARALREAGAGVELLDYDPRARVAWLAIDNPAAAQPGTVLRDQRLARPLEVRDLDLEASSGAMRASAWVRELPS